MENYWSKKKVFVAGGSGFIGSHIVRKLAVSGTHVYAASRAPGDTVKKIDRLRGIDGDVKRISLDLLDKRAVEDAFAKIVPDVVINAAGALNNNHDLHFFEDQINGNFTPAANLAVAAARNKVAKFVQIGSADEYGNAQPPITEATHEQSISPYSLSKIMSTHAVMLCGRLSGMATTVIRPAAAFGPTQELRLMLIPSIIKSSMDGKDFDMNPGEQIRDFLYVEDLADGILAAGASSRSDQEIFNLASNKGYKIKDVVNTLNRLLGNKIRINFGAKPYRPLDTMKFYMDASKAEKILGWKAKTPMEVALQQTIDWYHSNA